MQGHDRPAAGDGEARGEAGPVAEKLTKEDWDAAFQDVYWYRLALACGGSSVENLSIWRLDLRRAARRLWNANQRFAWHLNLSEAWSYVVGGRRAVRRVEFGLAIYSQEGTAIVKPAPEGGHDLTYAPPGGCSPELVTQEALLRAREVGQPICLTHRRSTMVVHPTMTRREVMEAYRQAAKALKPILDGGACC